MKITNRAGRNQKQDRQVPNDETEDALKKVSELFWHRLPDVLRFRLFCISKFSAAGQDFN